MHDWPGLASFSVAFGETGETPGEPRLCMFRLTMTAEPDPSVSAVSHLGVRVYG